jgi:uncharacterized protein
MRFIFISLYRTKSIVVIAKRKISPGGFLMLPTQNLLDNTSSPNSNTDHRTREAAEAVNIKSPPERFQILSLDGGGIRGLFSAAVLEALEDDLSVNISEHFDLIAGTSTGGIIALGLAAGFRPSRIVEFYVEHGPLIFDNAGIKKHWRAVQRYFTSPYSAEPLEAALKEVFGDRTLADCTKRIVIPTCNLDASDVYLFKTPHHPRLKRDWKVPIWQVARSTSAAPTYFSASTHVGGIRLVDGGMWANNPVLVAITEAVSMLAVPLEAMHVLSLGTTTSHSKRPPALDRGGLFAWAKPAVDVLMTVQEKSAHTQALHLIGAEKLCRLNPITPSDIFSLDKVDIRGLRAWASVQSRHLAPEFERIFKTHRAKPYSPLYPIKESQS